MRFVKVGYKFRVEVVDRVGADECKKVNREDAASKCDGNNKTNKTQRQE